MSETSASKFAAPAVKFKKLKAGKLNTQDNVLAAMKTLHAMAQAQAKAYGGKHSKLLPVGITEAPTFRTYLKLLERA